jgi:hypothetical protein
VRPSASVFTRGRETTTTSSAGSAPTEASHRASQRVMEKCGLTLQGELQFRKVTVVWYAIDR